MNVKFLKPASKEEWVFSVKGEEIILSPIKKNLILDDSVSFAGFRKDHPLLPGTTFTIKGKNVESSFKKAVKTYENELKELAKSF